jgi:hypothetical protein
MNAELKHGRQGWCHADANEQPISQKRAEENGRQLVPQVIHLVWFDLT